MMNYTGDRLNFGAAAERAKAEGLKVEMVVTAGKSVGTAAAAATCSGLMVAQCLGSERRGAYTSEGSVS